MPLVPPHHRAGFQNWAEARRWRELERECACTFAALHESPEKREEDCPPLAHTPPRALRESRAGLSVSPAGPFLVLGDPSPAIPQSAAPDPAGASIAADRAFVSLRSVRCSGPQGSCRSKRTNRRRPGIPI